MSKEQTPFGKAAKVSGQLKDSVEATGTGEVEVPAWLAAIILGFPQEILERVGVLAISEGKQTALVVSQERQVVVQEALAWAYQGEDSQNHILSLIYKALHRIAQASVTSGIEPSQVLGEGEQVLVFAQHRFPLLEGLAEYLVEGGKLSQLDQESLAGVAAGIFFKLKNAGFPEVWIWEQDGRVPGNFFATP